jgi:hypothetical protein
MPYVVRVTIVAVGTRISPRPRAARRLAEPARHTSPGMDETSQVPRKELLHVHKVSDCAGFFPCKPVRHGTMLPSLQRKEIGTSELDPFRRWSPCERFASALAGRRASLGVRGGWLDLPVGDFHLLFFASFLAHSGRGQKLRFDPPPAASGLPRKANIFPVASSCGVTGSVA